MKYKIKRLPTRKELLDRIEQYKRCYKNITADRVILHEAYDDNFRRIENAEKQSREHFKLLVIENSLNEQSLKFVTILDETPSRIKGIRERIRKGKYRNEKTKRKLNRHGDPEISAVS